MESLSEFLAQTSPTCGGVAHGAESSSSETVPDLSLGLFDLGSINWDLGNDFGATAATSSGVLNHLENQTANLLEQSANQYINDDRRAVSDDEAHRCFEGLDLLDFELNEEVLMTLTDLDNLHHVNSTDASSPIQAQAMDAAYFSQINSPSAEQTYSNLDSISTTMNTTAIGSPEESSALLSGAYDDSVMNYYSSSAEDSPAPSLSSTSSKIRRTRARTIDKKESNKAAAIKYRSKKMKEREILFAECEEYAKRNADLKKKIDDTQSEISFIKSLLVEALIAKSVPK